MFLLLCFRLLQLFFFNTSSFPDKYLLNILSVRIRLSSSQDSRGQDHRISITFLDINKFSDILSNHFLHEISIKIDELRYYVVSHTFTVYLFASFRFLSRVKMFAGCIVIKCPRICDKHASTMSRLVMTFIVFIKRYGILGRPSRF